MLVRLLSLPRSQSEGTGLHAFPLTPLNRTVVLAAREAARNPGGLFNPLLVLGPPACGKSRLLAALACDLRKQALTTYIASVPFLARAFVRAAREGSLDRFERGILERDALLLDDAERLAGRGRLSRAVARLAEIFLHRRRPVVGASRTHPRGTPGFDPRLAAILDSGFVAVFAPPRGTEPPPLDRIAQEAAQEAGTKAGALFGRGRSRLVARARAAFVSAALEKGFAPAEVGRFLAGRSPGAVGHLARRARSLGLARGTDRTPPRSP